MIPFLKPISKPYVPGISALEMSATDSHMILKLDMFVPETYLSKV